MDSSTIDLTFILGQIAADSRTPSSIKIIVHELINLKKTIIEQNKQIVVLTATLEILQPKQDKTIVDQKQDENITTINQLKLDCEYNNQLICDKIDENTANNSAIKKQSDKIMSVVDSIKKQHDYDISTTNIIAHIGMSDILYKPNQPTYIFEQTPRHVGKYIANNKVNEFYSIKRMDSTPIKKKINKNDQVILFGNHKNTTYIIHKKNDEIKATICTDSDQTQCKLIEKQLYTFDSAVNTPCYQFENDLQVMLQSNVVYIFKNDKSMAINISSSYNRAYPVFAIEFVQ